MVNSDNLALDASMPDVLNAVSTLKHNKSDGNKGEMSEHVIYACDDLSVHLSMLFSSLLVHGAVTDDFSVSTMVPIPKSKCITLSSNYRAITLSSIFAKLFDRILLDRHSNIVNTSHLHFGFKKKHSTTMCSLVLKEAMEYYNSNRGTVYCVT